jgi:hypothetical protein
MAKIAEPENPRPESEAHPTVNLDHIEFLMTEDVIAQNVTVEELHRLVAATEKSLRQTLKKIPFDFDLRVRFTIYIDRTVGIDLGLQVPIEGTTLPETLQQAANELNRLDEVRITAREHTIVICAYFQVKKTD